MAKRGFDVATFNISLTSSTGTFHDLGPYIDTFDGLEVFAETEESHAIGDAYVENAFTGLRRVRPIRISGYYDDVAASGPYALLGNATDVGSERVIKVNFGSTDSEPKQRVVVKRYSQRPMRGGLTKYDAEFLPSASYHDGQIFYLTLENDTDILLAENDNLLVTEH